MANAGQGRLVQCILGSVAFLALAACGGGETENAGATSEQAAGQTQTAAGAAAEDDEAAIVGKWQGFIDGPTGELAVIIEITSSPVGLQGSFLLPTFNAEAIPAETVAYSNGELLLDTGRPQDISFKGVLDEATGEVKGELSSVFGVFPLTLTKNNPDFKKLDHPRLDADGEPLRDYVYASPQAAEDGWSVSTLDAAKLDKSRIQSLMESILSGEQGRVDSILIARGGDLVVEEYFFGNERDKPHSIQSITKSVNSLLVGVAIDRGEIKSIDDPVYEYFPDRAETKWVAEKYPITLRHLLTMSAAIEWNETLPYSDPKNSNTMMNDSGDWLGFVLGLDQAGEPGRISYYSSGQSMLLGGVVKNATGLYSDEFAQETLFKDLGVDEFSWFSAPDGTRHTGGGLSLTGRDLMKMGELMRMGGVWNGKQVVPADYVEASWRDRLSMKDEETEDAEWAYGYQWWLPTYTIDGQKVEVISGIGYGGQYLGVVPSQDLVFVINGGEFVDGADRTIKPRRIIREFILPAALADGG